MKGILMENVSKIPFKETLYILIACFNYYLYQNVVAQLVEWRQKNLMENILWVRASPGSISVQGISLIFTWILQYKLQGLLSKSTGLDCKSSRILFLTSEGLSNNIYLKLILRVWLYECKMWEECLQILLRI